MLTAKLNNSGHESRHLTRHTFGKPSS